MPCRGKSELARLPTPTTTSSGEVASLIRVGSVCTGLGTDLAAMDKLASDRSDLRVDHVFACDVSPASKAIVHATYPELKHWYDDVFGESFSHAPKVDVLVAGFPCQPFSSEGAMQGPDDHRSMVICKILEYIRAQKPAVVLLENVAGLLHMFPETMMNIMVVLKSYGYIVDWRKLNSKTHGGVPQSRHRVYITGILRRRGARRMRWPQPVPMRRLSSILDSSRELHSKREGNKRACRTALPSAPSARKKVMRAIEEMRRKNIVDYVNSDAVCDCDGIGGRVTYGYVPCLTATRASNGGFWIFRKGSRLSSSELMRLQGMDPKRINLRRLGIGKRCLGKMIGNAFTQTVVMRILANAMECAGLVQRKRGARR